MVATEAEARKGMKVFANDIYEIVRCVSGLNKQYGVGDKEFDDNFPVLKKAVAAFNRKYNGLKLKLEKNIEEISLRVFVKEKDLKSIYNNSASKVTGVFSVGISRPQQIPLADAEKLADALEHAKKMLFVSYYHPDKDSVTILFEKAGDSIELISELEDFARPNTPEFSILAYYALKEGYNAKTDVIKETAKLGFVDLMREPERMRWLDNFNPYFGE